ncbi:MAG: DUF2240 family protein [Candidatus Lokiarchaeota archaeon]|nr:DUF2240 family protein [Candidatus Lokiarchaeota archaeon]
MVTGKDILWSISIPFRIKNSFELDATEFVNLLVFESLDVFSIEIAKKLITLAQEKGFIEIKDNKMKYKLPDLWKPMIYKLDWVPNFDDIGDVHEYNLPSLEKVPELQYIPKISSTLTIKSESDFIDELTEKDSTIRKERTIIENEVKMESIKEKKPKKKSVEEIIEEKKSPAPKKIGKKPKKHAKKDQDKKVKSLEDFF